MKITHYPYRTDAERYLPDVEDIAGYLLSSGAFYDAWEYPTRCTPITEEPGHIHALMCVGSSRQAWDAQRNVIRELERRGYTILHKELQSAPYSWGVSRLYPLPKYGIVVYSTPHRR